MAAHAIKDTTTYLTFGLGDEIFAMEVGNVREVLDLTIITRVPRTPVFMRGVINLRGGVVPVVDMRTKFGMPAAEDTVDTCIIVVEVDLDGEVTVIGALVDSVKEVFQINAEEIEPPPSIGMQLNTEFICGMGKQGDEFIIILDINRVFNSEELLQFQSADDVIETGDNGIEANEAIEEAVI